jgi:hypothetical protein
MSPYKHAEKSVEHFGGQIDDYLEIHKFLDSTKTHTTDNSHRAILHNSFGIDICERIFGDVIRNSDKKAVEVRYIVIKHIEEDLGFVPTVKDWCSEINKKSWMTGNIKKQTVHKSNIYEKSIEVN